MRLAAHIKPCLRELYWLCLCCGLRFTLLIHLEKTLRTLGHSDVGNSKSFHRRALQLGTSVHAESNAVFAQLGAKDLEVNFLG